MTWKLPISGPWRVTADYAQIIVGSFLVAISNAQEVFGEGFTPAEAEGT